MQVAREARVALSFTLEATMQLGRALELRLILAPAGAAAHESRAAQLRQGGSRHHIERLRLQQRGPPTLLLRLAHLALPLGAHALEEAGCLLALSLNVLELRTELRHLRLEILRLEAGWLVVDLQRPLQRSMTGGGPLAGGSVPAQREDHPACVPACPALAELAGAVALPRGKRGDGARSGVGVLGA